MPRRLATSISLATSVGAIALGVPAAATPMSASGVAALNGQITAAANAKSAAADKAAKDAAAAHAAAQAQAAIEVANARAAAAAAEAASKAAREAEAAATAAAEAAKAKQQKAAQEAAEAKAVADATAKAAAEAKAAVIPANPESIGFTAGSAGTSFDVSYLGYVAGAPADGLSGAARFEFVDAADAGRTWNFRIKSLANTSAAPITASRISQFGFNVSPDVASATAVGFFDTIDYAGNVPMAGLRDVCFRASAGGSCAGGGGAGLTIGESITDGYFSLMFDRALDAISLSSFFLRFQSIEGAAGTSGVGIGGAPSLLVLNSPISISGAGSVPSTGPSGPTDSTPGRSAAGEDVAAGAPIGVPEPGALGLLALGAVFVGWRSRRRLAA